MKEPLHCHSP